MVPVVSACPREGLSRHGLDRDDRGDCLSSLRTHPDPLPEEAPEIDVGRAHELVERALLSRLVRSPSHEPGSMAYPVAGDLVERDLAHQLGTELLVGEVLAMGPTAHGRLAGWRLGRCALTVRAKLLHQLTTGLLGESGGEADLPQLPIRPIQPQQQRTDGLTLEILGPPKADHHTIGRPLSFHLDSLYRSGEREMLKVKRERTRESRCLATTPSNPWT